MSLNQSDVVNMDGTERMKAFWMAIGSAKIDVPENIIFFTGSRLRQAGVHWAPFSFLGSNEFYNLRRPKSMEELASIDGDGLSASFSAFQFSFTHKPLAAEEEQINNHEDLRYVRFVRAARNDWMMLLPESKLQAAPEESLTAILETEILSNENYGGGTDVTRGVADIMEEECKDHTVFQPRITTNILRVNVGLASTLEATLYHGRAHNLTSLPVGGHSNGEHSLNTTSKYLRRLPNNTARHLIDVARGAFEQDPSLFPALTKQLDKQ